MIVNQFEMKVLNNSSNDKESKMLKSWANILIFCLTDVPGFSATPVMPYQGCMEVSH